MSWVYESWSKTSEKNGRIEVSRVFGRWEVFVKNTEQTTAYTNAMWRNALGRIPATLPVHRVLVLGLAGAGVIRLINKRFSSCKIDCVEWDPMMVEVFDRMKMYRPYVRPNVLIADAYELVPKLDQQYDLILLDLFTGDVAAHDLSRSSFFESLIARLSRQGMLVANVFHDTQVFDSFAPYAVRSLSWKYRFNELAIFQPLSCAKIGDPLPAGYRPFRAVPEYLEREAAARPGWKVVGTDGFVGLRWHVGPFWYDDFTGDIEPTIQARGPRRTVTWNRIANDGDVPKGWKVTDTKKLTGFVDITDRTPYDRWSPHAQRHLAKWNAQSEWKIVDISFADFYSAYKRISMTFLLKQFFLKLFREKHHAHGSRVRCFGARRRGTSLISAGLAVLDIPEAHQTIHLVSFIQPEAKASSVGVGLVDYWFTSSKARGIRFCDFDAFWTPGNPDSWEGFSRFKSQFGTQYVRYPASLVRRV